MPPRNREVRRFAAIWTLSTMVKIAALAVFFAILLAWPGGFRL